MIQTFEFYGQGRQIDAKGRYFRYESGVDGSGVVDINLTIDGNRIGRLSPGDDIELPTEATRWEILPVSNGCTGTVRVGNARITSQKLAGVVQVISGERSRVIAGNAYISRGFSAEPAAIGAGLTSAVQLWNPEGSGVMAFVTRVNAVVKTTTSAGIWLLQDTAELTGGNAMLSAAQPKNKRIGGPGTPLVSRVRSNLAAGYGTNANAIYAFVTKGDTLVDLALTEPIMLAPGSGVTLYSSTPQIEMDTFYQFDTQAA